MVPTMKKVALTPYSSSVLRIFGVMPGCGPSSKVRMISPGLSLLKSAALDTTSVRPAIDAASSAPPASRLAGIT